MSRIGKKPIEIPAGVQVEIDGQLIKAKGPKGELSLDMRPEIAAEIQGGNLIIKPKEGLDFKKEKRVPAFWGLTRALAANMLKGVSTGYEKKLELIGIGYKANLEGEGLTLSVGFSHPVKVKARPGIKFAVEKTVITVSGADKELVGQAAAQIRRIRPPEPYKGKGIRYAGERVRKKLGKKAAVTAK
ncbi:MAG: 50S ribosomal protein L6 [Candidatus Wildermuthbacteria bacterium RIFCSPHIGHO2_01_FULL_47_27]|uniref:Large ribosomal subunit protein uL6 n=2 Tax=Candidatus Wildermuthiibacteriota TaxID=1817923 RepID=A0A1G2RPK7_9BACT|nr:MAG: 50S ribosomal protein L6 [Candidatus Wildermuthbacteria bacterium RIFCSPHIGHO2_01_FULL_47_27]OHA67812.1 MAG: 50S ribosomal protein L6 [Candidatus Wildermuthbacteria bacterium RIFCSPHIGHO2_02_FULL_47_17]OHA73961.1 MAG: 50S ribosomal protein L6 [Candidatus Wildermuthbacteria bacterium RIFCSPLOWO2_01_FULL_48_35]OHA74796.1 MAG: 50S ribosomal protein L6 [Candidatus Wildermuthbacteria bacterium RIFCSPLOWO2_02_FULL_47_10]